MYSFFDSPKRVISAIVFLLKQEHCKIAFLLISVSDFLRALW